MSRRLFMDEAAHLAALVPSNRCPSTDAIEVLDENPNLRLALEDTWTDPVGRVYCEVPAERVSRWPIHLARSFRAFLRISRSPAEVFELIDLLNELDADEAVLAMTLRRCRLRKSLQPALAYYRELVAELESVTGIPDPRVEIPGSEEATCRPRLDGGDSRSPEVWQLREDPDEEPGELCPPTHRADLLHDPTSSRSWRPDWLRTQPRRFRTLYYRIKKARPEAVPTIKSHLLGLPKTTFTHSQWTVLWDSYRIVRDRQRRRRQQSAARELAPMASKLIRRIERVADRAELGYVGRRLYESMKGELRLPQPVAPSEWGVVFAAYRHRRAQLSDKAPQRVRV